MNRGDGGNGVLITRSNGDFSFRAIGMEVLGREWPAIAGGAAIQVYVAQRVYRSSQYSVRWIAVSAGMALVGVVAFGVESTLSAERLFENIGEGVHVRMGDELSLRWHMTWPALLGFGVTQLAVPACRSEGAFIAVAAAAGVLASWVIAIWLFTTNHYDLLLRVFLMPGGVGIVASVLGFTASSALWMTTIRVLSRLQA